MIASEGATRMLYEPEHVVDLDAGAIVDVALKLDDEADAKELAERVREAEEGLNDALDELRGMARVETVVRDMGYCDVEALVTLQTVGIRTAIPDPVSNRRLSPGTVVHVPI